MSNVTGYDYVVLEPRDDKWGQRGRSSVLNISVKRYTLRYDAINLRLHYV